MIRIRRRLALLAILLLTGPVAAQSAPLPQRATCRVAGGGVTPGASSRVADLAVTWANVDSSGLFTTCYAGSDDEWLDWGVLSTSTGSDIVGAVTIGYGTTALDPSQGGPGAALTVRFYSGALGAGQDGGRAPVKSLSLTGLPASPDGVVAQTWIVRLDLTGGEEFRLPTGPIGFSVSGDDDDGAGRSRTGPLLCYAGDGLGGADANGQVDFFDIWRPDTFGTYDGTWNFGGSPYDISSWYMVIETADPSSGPSAISVVRNDAGNVNPQVYSCSAGVLGEDLTGSAGRGPHQFVQFVAFAAPLEVSTGFGVILVDYTQAPGELLRVPFSYADPATFARPVPIDLNLAGIWIYTQAVRAGGGVSLTNACDVRLGF